MAELCEDQNVGVIPYSPLAAGFLTGKYTRDNLSSVDSTRSDGGLIQRLTSDEKAFAALDIVREIAEAHRVPVAHIALAWLLAKPTITSPIIGARTVDQITEVVGATEVTLSAEDVTRLDEATAGY